MKKFFNEFKTFIARGNVMDMAVGVIIGASFKAIVDSLVADIINPVLGIFGGMNFSDFKLQLNENATLNYGNFITAVINFLIMAFVIFCIVKFMNGMAAKFAKKKRQKSQQLQPPKCARSVKRKLQLMQADVRIVHLH